MTVAPTPVHPESHHGVRWMLVVVLAFALGAAAVAIRDHVGSSNGSTLRGSGVPAAQTRTVAPFTRVELAGANNVVVHVGEPRSVIVKADQNLLGHVTTEVQSGQLVIANTPGSFSTKSPMVVEVSAPRLESVVLSGSGNIVIDGLSSASFDASLPGSGTLTADGTATRLDVAVEGSGSVLFSRLVAQHVHAAVGGTGSVFVTATGTLAASVSGTGSIVYQGNPRRVTKSVTGSGTIVGS